MARKAAAKQIVKRKRGRPSLYTPELAQRVCDLVAQGRAMAKIAGKDGIPHITTLLRWFDLEEFNTLYARAKERAAEVMADEIVSIADDSKGDPDANSRRLRVDARKWVATKLLPKRYGDVALAMGVKAGAAADGGAHSLTEVLITLRQTTGGSE